MWAALIDRNIFWNSRTRKLSLRLGKTEHLAYSFGEWEVRSHMSRALKRAVEIVTQLNRHQTSDIVNQKIQSKLAPQILQDVEIKNSLKRVKKKEQVGVGIPNGFQELVYSLIS